MKKNVCCGWMAVVLPLLLCACSSPSHRPSELDNFDAFIQVHKDSITIAPRSVRIKALQAMEQSRDSLAYYNYLAVVLRTYFVGLQADTIQLLTHRIERFVAGQPLSPHLAVLQSECYNMKGNLFARMGQMDSAVVAFRQAYEWQQKGANREQAPDILMNLADAYNKLGALDVSASWYRQSLLQCDSLGLPFSRRVSAYYGLAQVYVSLRDFEQCDYYYNLAAQGYADMLPFEKHFYLNNRGTSYYYRGDYVTATSYFKRVEQLVKLYPDMEFEENLAWINLGDCYLHREMGDSARYYMERCTPFFKKIKMDAALYYLDTQAIGLALLQNRLDEVRRIAERSTVPMGIDPDMIHIRNRLMQRYSEQAGRKDWAYRYLKANLQMDDSLRNERVRMRTADLALRYRQDSTLMAKDVLIVRQQSEALRLRTSRIIWIGIAVFAVMAMLFGWLMARKRRALMEEKNRRKVSSLRLENIRNRLSPHFIFNVLNRQMAVSDAAERQQLASLVKLMRSNLELADELAVSLERELDFVRTYIELERPSLGATFEYCIRVAPEVDAAHVLLPSMLIQIPVENAIKHALRGKEGSRKLFVTVQSEADAVRIRVTDNGGGYRSSGGKSAGTGTGMKVVMQTIQILNGKNKNGIDVGVHNVTLPSGEVGCEVSFLIPLHYHYVL